MAMPQLTVLTRARPVRRRPMAALSSSAPVRGPAGSSPRVRSAAPVDPWRGVYDATGSGAATRREPCERGFANPGTDPLWLASAAMRQKM
jgi:hypothetical protein